MTFHGTTRADHHTYEHAHESPLVMLIPLGLLAVGAVLAGIVFQSYFIGEARGEFWRAALFEAPGKDIFHHMHEVPAAVVWAPTLAMLAGPGWRRSTTSLRLACRR